MQSIELQPELLSLQPLPGPVAVLDLKRLIGNTAWRRAYRKSKGYCLACGSKARLKVQPRYEMQDNFIRIKELAPVCGLCWYFINSETLGRRFFEEKITFRELCRVMYHGFKTQKDNGYLPNPFALRVYEAASRGREDLPRWHEAALHAVELNPLPAQQKFREYHVIAGSREIKVPGEKE